MSTERRVTVEAVLRWNRAQREGCGHRGVATGEGCDHRKERVWLQGKLDDTGWSYELREGQGSRESYRVAHRTPMTGSTKSKCEHLGKLERGPPSTREERQVDHCAFPSQGYE